MFSMFKKVFISINFYDRDSVRKIVNVKNHSFNICCFFYKVGSLSFYNESLLFNKILSTLQQL